MDKKKVPANSTVIRDIEFNEEDSKELYLDKVFWKVKVGVAPEYTRSLKNKSKKNVKNTA